MEMFLRSCDGKHDDIYLPDGTTTYVGRSIETKISDKKCSRKQLELCADYSTKSVAMKMIGTTPSSINNCEMAKGESKTLKENETLHIILNLYPHQLIIKEPEKAEKSEKKRTISDFFGGGTSKKPKLDSNSNVDSGDEALVKAKLEKLQKQTFAPSTGSINSEKSDELLSVENTRGAGWYNVGVDMLVYESAGLKHSSRVVAFDMDSTLITTKSGKTFAVDNKDWKLLFSQIPGKLQTVIKERGKVVIITNQLGIGKGKVKEVDFKKKIEAVLEKLNVAAQVVAITKRGKNRKPNIGSWKWLKEDGNGGVELTDFTYVGDAAGRPKNWAPGKKKDFSCGDRLFAMNLGVPFFTPEEFFLSQKSVKFEMPSFNPKSIPLNAPLTEGGDVTSDKQEVIVMVGYPASGKSSFVKNNILPKGYVHVNRDTMKTWQKCVAACKQALASGKSVVVDNTNADMASRKRYVDCAKAQGCQCRCFVSTVTIEHAFHNNRFRELSGSEHDIVPAMIIYSFRKNYVEPSKAEGFDSIVKFNFVPKFDDNEQQKMYSMFLD
uniref:Bifunctional polynucleotide phosphatase/kinase n=1 Tax=Phallusia mammillata TaxID=59560 RepID=A0A6F9DNG4_9ASCI|nr:bifunctional polynucleotide phosphatase/kinase [Phallusia mammillata]